MCLIIKSNVTVTNMEIHPEANLEWLEVKLDYVGEASLRALRHHHFCVKIYSDIIKALCPQWLITPSHVFLVLEQFLYPLTKWPHKVLSQQTEVSVKVEVCVCVALRGEVGSKEGPVLQLELLRSWADGYGPEILLLFVTWVGNSEHFVSMKLLKEAKSFPWKLCSVELKAKYKYYGLLPAVCSRA